MEYTLKQARKKLGLSQQDLADRMGVSRPRISELERQGSSSVSTLIKVAEATGMHLILKPGQEGFWLIDPPADNKTQDDLMQDLSYLPDAEQE